MDQAHLVEALDGVLRRLGGTARKWRTDHLATVIRPGSADVQASFVPVAKHYGAIVVPCPPRRGNRRGRWVRVRSAPWWRTMTATTPEAAQVSLDRFWATTGDARLRPPALRRAGHPHRRVRPTWPTVGELAEGEALMALPAVPFPATIEEAHPSMTEPRWRLGGTATPSTRPGRRRAHAASPPADSDSGGLHAWRCAAGGPSPGAAGGGNGGAHPGASLLVIDLLALPVLHLQSLLPLIEQTSLSIISLLAIHTPRSRLSLPSWTWPPWPTSWPAPSRAAQRSPARRCRRERRPLGLPEAASPSGVPPYDHGGRGPARELDHTAQAKLSHQAFLERLLAVEVAASTNAARSA